MIECTVLEWGRLPYDEDIARSDTIPIAMADRLAAVARRTRQGGVDGGRILEHGRDSIRAGQIVGVLAAEGCALEILPKIDLVDSTESHVDRPAALRRELIHMLAVALDLDIAVGSVTALGTQHETLLEVLIRLFCMKLFEAVRRGLPRRYVFQADDLPALRGSLDVMRQFSLLAASPQRLACRYDALSPDIALNQILKATVSRLEPFARSSDNMRSLRELSFAFADVTDVGRLLARSLARDGFAVRLQGGGRYCLVELNEDGATGSVRFLTRPDIIVSQKGVPRLIIDTKWKRLVSQIDDPKRGVAQGDIYQLMAYGRLYDCPHLMLLYPHHNDLHHPEGVVGRHRIEGGDDRLTVATIRLGQRSTIEDRLKSLITVRPIEAFTS